MNPEDDVSEFGNIRRGPIPNYNSRNAWQAICCLNERGG
jgi:hypothetical protein